MLENLILSKGARETLFMQQNNNIYPKSKKRSEVIIWKTGEST